jgi:release factor glutamine methyltransferase
VRLLDAVRSATQYLGEAGVEDSFVDAELLTLHAAGIDRLTAYRENPEIDKTRLARVRRLARRRASGEPVQYIIGHVDFLGLKIEVGKGVLIPRPETELLAEEAIVTIHDSRFTVHRSALILDLCTGSGCIALAIAREIQGAEVYGTDVAKAALRYAQKNAVINGIWNVRFIQGSLFVPVENMLFDLIVSNPPYIRTPDIEGLQREIREWEPVSALDGGPDGLDFYREIFAGAAGHLRERGAVIVELGFDQAEDVMKIARQSGFSSIEIRKDYAGIERILKACKKKLCHRGRRERTGSFFL